MMRLPEYGAPVELLDRREQRAADVGIGKSAADVARRDARLHHLVVLRERHHDRAAAC